MKSDEGDPWPEPRGLLPRIACVGRFESFEAAKDRARDGSELTIIWFQDEFAFPIDPGVREHIRAIRLGAAALDFIRGNHFAGTSHSFTVPSLPAETSVLPSGANSTPHTGPLRPLRVLAAAPSRCRPEHGAVLVRWR